MSLHTIQSQSRDSQPPVCLILCSLDTRVILEDMGIPKISIILEPLIPVITDPIHLLHLLRVLIQDPIQQRLLLQDLNRQTTRRMPRNMAVEQPRTRVVGLEGNDEISSGGKKRNISTRRVVELEIDLSCVQV